jgi:hypothetical protein
MKVFIIVNSNKLSEVAFRYNPKVIKIIQKLEGTKWVQAVRKWYIPNDKIQEFSTKLVNSDIELICDYELEETNINHSTQTSDSLDIIEYPLKRSNSSDTNEVSKKIKTEAKTINAKVNGSEGDLTIYLPLPLPLYIKLKQSINGILWSNKNWIIKGSNLETFYTICASDGYKIEYLL